MSLVASSRVSGSEGAELVSENNLKSLLISEEVMHQYVRTTTHLKKETGPERFGGPFLALEIFGNITK
jgi:hypothetical protein